MYVRAIREQNPKAISNLGIMYREQKKYQEAEKMFLDLYNHSQTEHVRKQILNHLGLLYIEQKKNMTKQKKCF